MNRNRKTILILSTAVFAAVALVGFGAMAGYQQRVSNEEVEPQSEIIDIYPSSGMEVELSISNAPALNETAELTCVVTSVRDAKNTTARIELPEGFVFVSGDLTWAGDIIVPEEEKLKHPRPPSDCSGPECNRLWRGYEYPKGRVEFSAVVKAVKVGHWNISARARGEGIPGGGIDRIYISVFKDKATVSDSPPLAEDWAFSERCPVVNESEIPPRMQPPAKRINIPKPAKHDEENLRPLPPSFFNLSTSDAPNASVSPNEAVSYHPNDPTYRGVAHNATILSANADSPWDIDIINASEWAINAGAEVLSLSILEKGSKLFGKDFIKIGEKEE